MARRFFNPESGVWKPLGFFGDLVILSLLWCLCSVPLVTLGPATAALYDTVVHSMRRKEAPPFYRFFDTFRRELKEGVLLKGKKRTTVKLFIPDLYFADKSEKLPMGDTVWVYMGEYYPCHCVYWPREDAE